jgi:dihydrofolate reductase
VVTRNPAEVELPTSEQATGYAVTSVELALGLAAELETEEIYVAGGGSIYAQAWPYLTDLDLTEVHAEAEGSVHFPEIDPAEWVEVRREVHAEFDFVGYRRLS